VLSVRPGITDPASILYADEEGILAAATNPQRLYEETILPRKLELNLRYIENMSLTIDISLILKTFSRIFVKR
jgi:lipopolysaccharide/colanic/teichoic acid biosynthesis glycosyltransferase